MGIVLGNPASAALTAMLTNTMRNKNKYILIGVSAEFTMTEASNRVMVDLIENYAHIFGG